MNSPKILRRIGRWSRGVLRTSSLLAQEDAFDTCRHLLATKLRICTWNARGLLGSAASGQKPRENKLKHLKKISKNSHLQSLEGTHGRIEHLMNNDAVPDRCTWMKVGIFTPGSVNAGGSVILAREASWGLILLLNTWKCSHNVVTW